MFWCESSALQVWCDQNRVKEHLVAATGSLGLLRKALSNRIRDHAAKQPKTPRTRLDKFQTSFGRKPKPLAPPTKTKQQVLKRPAAFSVLSSHKAPLKRHAFNLKRV